MAADTVKTNEDLKSHQLRVNTCVKGPTNQMWYVVAIVQSKNNNKCGQMNEEDRKKSVCN